MTRTLTLAPVLAALLLMIPVAHAGGSAAAGKKKAVVCFACHGENGNSLDPQYPRLGGQYAQYIVQALKEYQDGQRKNPIMVGFASTLTEQDREDIAAYFAAQKPAVWTLRGEVSGSHKRQGTSL
ncbi:cytochrome c class I [mine drainage metagenome]|uniref:Cytochrome c class I n=1 Tax=mine drainage metagenome TaxID=410659 RepID=T1AV85_9ZZZZ